MLHAGDSPARIVILSRGLAAVAGAQALLMGALYRSFKGDRWIRLSILLSLSSMALILGAWLI